MPERLTFGFGISAGPQAPAPPAIADRAADPPARAAQGTRDEQPRDWAFVGLMLFTGLLFFRPQDMFAPLGALHLAELSAIFALGMLVLTRLRRGLAVTRMTVELGAVAALGAVILLTAPFAVWPGGAVATFTDLYAKVMLIYVLMVNTLTTPRRIEQFTLLIVLASGYLAGRAVLDYARGVNLIENGRVQGAVGGMFKNPNDLALNMVAVLPLCALLALRPGKIVQRALAALSGVLMIGAIVASQSRSGTVGLAAMVVVLAAYLLPRKPGLVFAGVLAGILALPLLPASYWERIASITNEELDQTGSREARSTLLTESYQAFLDHPMTGVGAGQFKNYNPEGRVEAWRESHNAVLQVAAELGILGVAVFLFLIACAVRAPLQTRRLLRAARPAGRSPRAGPALTRAEADDLNMHAAALLASIVGWFVCALFASVAYHWTFYYLLALAAAPRDYLRARFRAARAAGRRSPVTAPEPVGAHA